ncbi:MAG TPA: hypothetical protein PKV72_04865 [Candidatus Peribacteria bacterium]|nr:hypothetical protein [Candidatus Peribacteria bacterium]
MSSPEAFPTAVMMEEPEAPAVVREPTRAERDAARAAEFDRDPHFQWLLAQRNAAVTRIRSAIEADLQATGAVTERVLNLIRAFKEDYQDFRFGDLISYDDVFEDSDRG